MNRLVDAIQPESETAREFNELTKAIVSGKASPEQWDRAKQQLLLWRNNDNLLQPRLRKSELTAELIPVSHTLSLVAEIGLQALNELQTQHACDSIEVQKNLQALKVVEKPEAVLRDMIIPPSGRPSEGCGNSITGCREDVLLHRSSTIGSQRQVLLDMGSATAA